MSVHAILAAGGALPKSIGAQLENDTSKSAVEKPPCFQASILMVPPDEIVVDKINSDEPPTVAGVAQLPKPEACPSTIAPR